MNQVQIYNLRFHLLRNQLKTRIHLQLHGNRYNTQSKRHSLYSSRKERDKER